MKRQLFGRGGDNSGAVAATVGLSLFALVAAGGIAFDYARLATLDTEMQNAADQAALAAATQLDQEAGAVARATAAAQGLLANQTLLANDGNASNRSITTAAVLFYASKAHAEAANGTNCPTANAIDPAALAADATARFVCVRTASRVANYALTPIVAAFSSGNVSAMAVAGLGSAICKTPPVMICNPQETPGNPAFNASSLIGKGVRLTSVGNGSGSWVPGNFGYLDSNDSRNGAGALREALGWTTPPGDCVGGSGVDTKTGANVSVTDALNTRFDIYDGNTSCPSGGLCPASVNSVKDVVRSANASGNNSCRLHNAGWGEAAANRYLPTSPTTPLPTTTTPSAMGHPRDMCHAVSVHGSCAPVVGGEGSRIGDGAWDRDAYFRVNYRRADGTRWSGTDWRTNTGLSTAVATTAPNYASRYNVYAWEIANRYALTGTLVDGVKVLDANPDGATGATKVAYGKSICSAPQGQGAALVPGGTTVDRRRLSVAVLNCIQHNVHGDSDDVPVVKWIEVFLVEPSINRTDGRTNAGDIYVEVIGETDAGAGATAGQVIRRDVPYLVK